MVTGRAALDGLARYVGARPAERWTLVADANTYAALGERVERALRDAGAAVTPVVLRGRPGRELLADDATLVKALTATPAGPQAYLAVGAGTITDITRFVAHRTGNRFVSAPSAPSMDGYATSNNTLTLQGLKVSLPGKTPEAIFCDTETLAAAPMPLIAAGLGDNLARFTSVNDLRLGALVWGERWDEAIGARMEALGQVGLARARAIAQRDEGAIGELTAALLDSGLAMGEFGNSAPGAGSEHHISHCWEMRLQAGSAIVVGGEGIAPLQHLHGAKVGVGSVMAAGWYATIREMTAREAANRLSEARWPDPDEEMAAIRRVYGPVAEQIIAAQRPFLFLTAEQWDALKGRILDGWEEIRALAARIPPPERIADALREAGGPASGAELGLSAAEVEVAARYAMHTRPRFTVARLRVVLGI
jgi:glycerol-1-phosphate dehydrogenase [NAD(P)+]